MKLVVIRDEHDNAIVQAVRGLNDKYVHIFTEQQTVLDKGNKAAGAAFAKSCKAVLAMYRLAEADAYSRIREVSDGE